MVELFLFAFYLFILLECVQVEMVMKLRNYFRMPKMYSMLLLYIVLHQFFKEHSPVAKIIVEDLVQPLGLCLHPRAHYLPQSCLLH